jgi:hypothetical protein
MFCIEAVSASSTGGVAAGFADMFISFVSSARRPCIETMTKVAAAIERIILAASYLLLPKLEALCIQRNTPRRFRGALLSSRRELSNGSQI